MCLSLTPNNTAKMRQQPTTNATSKEEISIKTSYFALKMSFFVPPQKSNSVGKYEEETFISRHLV